MRPIPIYTTILLALTLLTLSCAGEETVTIVEPGAEPEEISTGHRFTEGPYWHPEGTLYFSDIPADRIYRWTPQSGSEVWVEPSGNANGIAGDLTDNMVVAQHAGRVSRLSRNGNLEVIVDQYEGKRLNSPNDLTVHSSGTIFFTDPPFGVTEEERQLEISGVFRYTPSGELVLIYDGFDRPNGAVLSPDESLLYVNDSATGNIIVLDVDAAGNATNPRQFATVGPSSSGGAADGMVVDSDGRLYSTGPAGISVFNPDGEHLEDISFPQRVTNMDWGGPENRTLFVTSVDKVYSLQTAVQGHKAR